MPPHSPTTRLCCALSTRPVATGRTPGLRLGVESKTPARGSPARASQVCVTPSTGPGRVGLLPQARQHSFKALGVRVGKVFLPQVLAELAPLRTVPSFGKWHSFFKTTQRTPPPGSPLHRHQQSLPTSQDPWIYSAASFFPHTLSTHSPVLQTQHSGHDSSCELHLAGPFSVQALCWPGPAAPRAGPVRTSRTSQLRL